MSSKAFTEYPQADSSSDTDMFLIHDGQTVKQLSASQLKQDLREDQADFRGDIDWVDVKDDIDFTPGDNCDSSISAHPTAAYISNNVLYIKFSVRPSSDLSSNANVDIRYTGFTPKFGGDWRIGFGIIGIGFYCTWTATDNDGYPVIRCRYISSNGWNASSSPIFTGIIPLV